MIFVMVFDCDPAFFHDWGPFLRFSRNVLSPCPLIHNTLRYLVACELFNALSVRRRLVVLGQRWSKLFGIFVSHNIEFIEKLRRLVALVTGKRWKWFGGGGPAGNVAVVHNHRNAVLLSHFEAGTEAPTEARRNAE